MPPGPHQALEPVSKVPCDLETVDLGGGKCLVPFGSETWVFGTAKPWFSKSDPQNSWKFRAFKIWIILILFSRDLFLCLDVTEIKSDSFRFSKKTIAVQTQNRRMSVWARDTYRNLFSPHRIILLTFLKILILSLSPNLGNGLLWALLIKKKKKN